MCAKSSTSIKKLWLERLSLRQRKQLERWKSLFQLVSRGKPFRVKDLPGKEPTNYRMLDFWEYIGLVKRLRDGRWAVFTLSDPGAEPLVCKHTVYRREGNGREYCIVCGQERPEQKIAMSV